MEFLDELEFSHQFERRLAVSPRLNEDVQNLAFTVTATPAYNCLPSMETNTSSRSHRPSGRGRPRLSLRAMIPPNFRAQEDARQSSIKGVWEHQCPFVACNDWHSYKRNLVSSELAGPLRR